MSSYWAVRGAAECTITVKPPHPWHRLVYEAAARARTNNATAVEVVIAIEGVVHVFRVDIIDLRSARHGELELTMHTVPQGDPFAIPVHPTTPAGGSGG